mgnify:FL=1
MDYKELNDNELVYLCCENSEEAYNTIINKYKPIILSTVKQYMKELNIVGSEINDFYQEGLIGLMTAINTYDETKDTTFYTYATKCIKNNMLSSVRKSFSKKSKILNDSYSLDKMIDDSNLDFYDVFSDERSNPLNILFEEEEGKVLLNKLKDMFSSGEKEIFEYKVLGLSNAEIAEKINKSKKYVENTMFRIGKKYRELMNKK